MATTFKKKPTVKMSITKALAEVKEINRKLSELKHIIIVCVEKGNTNQIIETKGVGTPTEFKVNTKGVLDKMRDLVSRRNEIKKAIAKANLETQVIVAGQKMPIIQAIDAKEILKEQITIFEAWILQFIKCDEIIEQQEYLIQNSAQQSINAAFGSNQQTKPQVAKEMEASYRTIYEGKICSNYTREQIQKLKDEVVDALATIDITLSEANSRTDIEIAM